MIYLFPFCYGHDDSLGGYVLHTRGQTSLLQSSADIKIRQAIMLLSPQNGVDYNPGKKVPDNEIKSPVEEVNIIDGAHRRPDKGNPNSVYSNYQDGILRWERYYNEKGEPYLDVDYTDHGRPEIHSVPHYHRITDEKGHFIRGGINNV